MKLVTSRAGGLTSDNQLSPAELVTSIENMHVENKELHEEEYWIFVDTIMRFISIIYLGTYKREYPEIIGKHKIFNLSFHHISIKYIYSLAYHSCIR